MMSSRMCSSCTHLLPAWDAHPRCFSCRECRRDAPCLSYCIGLSSEHFDALEKGTSFGPRRRKGKNTERARASGKTGLAAGCGKGRDPVVTSVKVLEAGSVEQAAKTEGIVPPGQVGHGGDGGESFRGVSGSETVPKIPTDPVMEVGKLVLSSTVTEPPIGVSTASSAGSGGAVVSTMGSTPVVPVTGGDVVIQGVVPPGGVAVSGTVLPGTPAQPGQPIVMGHSLVVNDPSRLAAHMSGQHRVQWADHPSGTNHSFVMNGRPSMATHTSEHAQSGVSHVVTSQPPVVTDSWQGVTQLGQRPVTQQGIQQQAVPYPGGMQWPAVAAAGPPPGLMSHSLAPVGQVFGQQTGGVSGGVPAAQQGMFPAGGPFQWMGLPSMWGFPWMCPPGMAVSDPVGQQQPVPPGMVAGEPVVRQQPLPGYAGTVVTSTHLVAGRSPPQDPSTDGTARLTGVGTSSSVVTLGDDGSAPSSSVGVPTGSRADRNAHRTPMVPSDTHSSGPSSSTDDSDSEGGGGEHDSDSREEGTHAREPTSVGLEPLSPATTAGEFPSDTQEIVERLARGLSLDYGSPEVPEAPSLLSMGGLGARQRREEPALKFPSNIAETWLKYDEKTPEGKPTVDLSFHSYADVLRVSDDDYVTLLWVPGMDDDVAKFLPSDGKTSPMRYSQYWEEQLKVLDTRARVLLKLSCFSYLLSNHLGNQIVDSSGRECAMWRECNLAASLATTSMHEAMLLSR